MVIMQMKGLKMLAKLCLKFVLILAILSGTLTWVTLQTPTAIAQQKSPSEEKDLTEEEAASEVMKLYRKDAFYSWTKISYFDGVKYYEIGYLNIHEVNCALYSSPVSYREAVKFMRENYFNTQIPTL